MNNNILTLTRKLLNKKTQSLTIPEIGVKLIVDSPLLIATMLQPFIDDLQEEETDQIDEKQFDENIIKQAIKKIRDIETDHVVFLVLIGTNIVETYGFVKSKWKNKIIDNNKFKPIFKDNEIILPVKSNTIRNNDIKALSLSGTTIYKVSKLRTAVFSNGKVIEIYTINDQGLFHLINSLGYFLDEFVLAALILRISGIAPNLKKVLLENINTTFVNSLVAHTDIENYYPFKGYKSKIPSSFLKTAIDILTTIPFARIKDYNYEFVSAFMYEDKD